MYLYEITNIVNGKGYVGITKNRIGSRWSAHRKALEKRTHSNGALQKDYNRFGTKCFEYHVRQEFGNIIDLQNAEKAVIIDEKFRLYNLRSGGYDAPPIKHSEEAKRKIGEAAEVSVVGMSIITGEIKEYSRVLDTALDGFNYKNIGKCCAMTTTFSSGRTQQAISTGKWVWMHKKDFNLEEMNRRAELARNRGKNNQSRPIIGKSLLDGSIINFKSCLEAGKILRTYHTSIRACCAGELSYRSCSRYVWVFADEHNPTILLEERYNYALLTFNGNKVIGPRPQGFLNRIFK